MSLGRPDLVLACPRDGAEMTKVDVEGVKLDRCTSCGGTWFDDAELRIVAASKEMEALALKKRQFPLTSPFACPRCGGKCQQSFVAEVEVDVCTQCQGVWLDKGELEEAKRQLTVRKATSAAGPGFVSFLARL